MGRERCVEAPCGRAAQACGAYKLRPVNAGSGANAVCRQNRTLEIGNANASATGPACCSPSAGKNPRGGNQCLCSSPLSTHRITFDANSTSWSLDCKGMMNSAQTPVPHLRYRGPQHRAGCYWVAYSVPLSCATRTHLQALSAGAALAAPRAASRTGPVFTAIVSAK